MKIKIITTNSEKSTFWAIEHVRNVENLGYFNMTLLVLLYCPVIYHKKFYIYILENLLKKKTQLNSIFEN